MFLGKNSYKKFIFLSLSLVMLMTDTSASRLGSIDLDKAYHLRADAWSEKCRDFKEYLRDFSYLYDRWEHVKTTKLAEGFERHLKKGNVRIPLLENGVVRTYVEDEVSKDFIGEQSKEKEFEIDVVERKIVTFGDERKNPPGYMNDILYSSEPFLYSSEPHAIEVFPNEVSVNDYSLFKIYEWTPDDIQCNAESEIADKRILYSLFLKKDGGATGSELYYLDAVNGFAQFANIGNDGFLEIYFESENIFFTVSYNLFDDQPLRTAFRIMKHITVID